MSQTDASSHRVGKVEGLGSGAGLAEHPLRPALGELHSAHGTSFGGWAVSGNSYIKKVTVPET